VTDWSRVKRARQPWAELPITRGMARTIFRLFVAVAAVAALAGLPSAAAAAAPRSIDVVLVLGHGQRPVHVLCVHRGRCVVQHPERYSRTEVCRWRVDAHRVLQGKRTSRYLPVRCWTPWMRAHLHPDPAPARR
jgi:hypothetical protein